jgi:hypothetical protein
MKRPNFYFEAYENGVWKIANKQSVPDTPSAYLLMFLTYLDEVGYDYSMSLAPKALHKNIILYPAHLHDRILAEENLFYNHAKPETMQMLRAGVLSLVFMHSSEALPRQIRKFEEWKALHVAQGIPAEKIYLLCANLEPLDVNHLPYDYWQHDHSLVTQRREGTRQFDWEFRDRAFHRTLSEEDRLLEQVDIDAYVAKKEKEYLFLSYNRNCRPHRTTLFSRLTQENLLEKARYSLLWPKKNFELFEYKAQLWLNPDHKAYFDDVFRPLYEPKVIDNTFEDLLGADDRKFSYRDHFVTAYFSLITETSASIQSTPVLWHTEKTYKPLAIGHPFMVMGCPGSLAYLRSEGYATFPEFFDESYDEMKLEVRRREAIVSEVRRLSQLSSIELDARVEAIKDKLVHNRNLLLTKNYKYLYDRIFQKIK